MFKLKKMTCPTRQRFFGEIGRLEKVVQKSSFSVLYILFSGVTSLPHTTKIGLLEEVKLSRGYIWLQWRIGELSIN
jgi:hypothetical protein